MLLCEQVCHSVAGGNVWEEPERVLQVGQQTHIRIRKRRPRTRLQILDCLRSVPAADTESLALKVDESARLSKRKSRRWNFPLPR